MVAETPELAREAAAVRGIDPDSLRRETDVLDTWFSSALWPFATLGWPEETPELRAFYPTDVLSTARDIIFLWVARMVMFGVELTGEIPFTEVNIHSVIQAPDGRRMSKSLGTGIDPLDLISEHGADALRFGLLAMSSGQDVRFNEERVKQGRDLANKLWNAARLILLRVSDVQPDPRGGGTVEVVTEHLDSFDFAHAVLELYRFFWSEFCDWYLEIVKPRLYEGEPEVAANLLHVLERFLALAHPVIPFVTEQVWGYLPGRADSPLIVASYPVADPVLRDPAAEGEIEASIELTRGVRRWRDLAGVPVASVLPARVAGDAPHELVARLARLDVDGAGGEALASIGPLQLLANDDVDPQQVRERIEARAAELRSEVERAERKLGNDGFVAKAPAEVVEAEREKLEAYRTELGELER